MARIFTVTNQKGGTGKSTTAAALTAGLSLRGYKTLCIDMDAQGNLSHSMKADISGATILGVLTGEVSAAHAIQCKEEGDIIPASRSLAGADAFIKDTGKEYRLREALEPITDNYDFIVIDTPPSLGILTINSLTACDSVIIPMQADIYSLQGVSQLAETIQPVKKYCNHSLKIEGLLLTRFSHRSVLSREVVEIASQLAGNLQTRLFDTRIREAIAVKEAQITQQSIFSYAPKSNAAIDYNAFIDEILRGE